MLQSSEKNSNINVYMRDNLDHQIEQLFSPNANKSAEILKK